MAIPTRYKRRTLVEAANCLARLDSADLDNLALLWGLEDYVLDSPGISRQRKVNLIIRLAADEPDRQTDDGVNIWDEMVEYVAKRAVRWLDNPSYEAFVRALEREGYQLVDDATPIRPMLPPIAALPEAEDDVHALLDEFGMVTAKGQLEQAIKNHADGCWAAANGQFRPFIEGLFDGIAAALEPANAPMLKTSENRRELLASREPPFLYKHLGEWTQDGKNFINGLFKRLHAEGPHPGLSDEEDCTFRLHLALIVARHYLRRLRGYKP